MNGEKHYYQGKGFNALLHVEMIEESKMNAKLYGDPVIVCKMIRTAMEAQQDIAAAMIAAVVDWSNKNGWDAGELKNMVKFFPK